MKFRNPWIDPRVLGLKPAQAEIYLSQQGWKPLPPYSKLLTAYQRPTDPPDGPIVYVPKTNDETTRIERMIELVAALAFAEDRWAVEVLSDILQAKTVPSGGNGSAATQAVERAGA
jgi:hypothetical protein